MLSRVAKLLDLTPFLQRSTRLEVLTLSQSLLSSSIQCGDRGVLIAYLYKKKGNRQCCDNHHDISLLSIAGKILARVFLNRLFVHLELGLLHESQRGYTERAVTPSTWCSQHVSSRKSVRSNTATSTQPLLTFNTEAFDTVSCKGLWKIMAKFGCPDMFITLVRSFHDGMLARVLADGESNMPVCWLLNCSA